MRDTLWRLFHGGLYTADKLAHINPRHSASAAAASTWSKKEATSLTAPSTACVEQMAWLGPEWLGDLWDLLLPPKSRGAGTYTVPTYAVQPA